LRCCHFVFNLCCWIVICAVPPGEVEDKDSLRQKRTEQASECRFPLECAERQIPKRREDSDSSSNQRLSRFTDVCCIISRWLGYIVWRIRCGAISRGGIRGGFSLGVIDGEVNSRFLVAHSGTMTALKSCWTVTSLLFASEARILKVSSPTDRINLAISIPQTLPVLPRFRSLSRSVRGHFYCLFFLRL